MIDGVDESLSSEHKTNFRQLILKHSDVFSKGDHDLSCATAVKHRIDTGSSQPVRQALRRQPPHYFGEIGRQTSGKVRVKLAHLSPNWPQISSL